MSIAQAKIYINALEQIDEQERGALIYMIDEIDAVKGGGSSSSLFMSSYSGSGAIGTSLATIAFDGTEKTDTGYTNTSGVISVSSALNNKWVEINVQVGAINAGNNRVQLTVELQQETTPDVWTIIAKAENYSQRNNTQNDGGVCISGFLHQLSDSQDLRVQVFRQGASTSFGGSTRNWISIKTLD